MPYPTAAIPPHSPRIVIIGAGFGGLQAAQSLAGCDAEVILVDRCNYHIFTPLLYQVATGVLDANAIACPVRRLLRNAPNVRFLRENVSEIDFDKRVIQSDTEILSYDYLVLATGSKAQFLGISGAQEHSFPLKTLADAIAIRSRIVDCLETAVAEPDRTETLLTFAIVGGGTTGVEVAGSLAEWVRTILAKDYPNLDRDWVRIVLVQSGDRLLEEFSPSLGNYACKRLRKLGVEIRLGTKVDRVTPTELYLDTGETIATETTIWTAGVEVDRPDILQDVQTESKGKLPVRSTLELRDRVYAIGDLAYLESDGKPLPGIAPVALQQGVAVADNLRRQLRGKMPKPFKFFNKGRLAIVGGYTGVGNIAGFRFRGFLAWLLWLQVHWVYLPGWYNRFVVLLSWLAAYLGRDRVATLQFRIQSSEFRVQKKVNLKSK